MLADEILRVASSWNGVPYLGNGRTRGGVDCANFCAAVFFETGVLRAMPDLNVPDGYWRRPGDVLTENIERSIRDLLSPGHVVVDVERPEPGALVTISQLRFLRKATHALLVEAVSGNHVFAWHAERGRCVGLTMLPDCSSILKVYAVRRASDG